ncbi:MAG: ribonuclease HI family protein [Aquabacterium sp.]|uniref:ribonuclease HI family protein n=1 Tax=Aquabacterium sp. TaxID=1872578 RepID=UPI001B4149A0|nr:ribonuclease HI family protein [Aquabacterium sp.]MBP7131254.1 ribonuclease HI family protein [Aquabacterium sp.]
MTTQPHLTSACATWVIHCDGSALPNPGRMGLGAVIIAPDGARQTLSQATHTIGCNNEAELLALMSALQFLPENVTHIELYSDSSILVAQLTHPDVQAIERLAHLFNQARQMLTRFTSVTVRWLPRHRNTEADALARSALGLPPKLNTSAVKRARHKR